MINLPTKITALRILLTPIIIFIIFHHNQSIREHDFQSPYLYILLIVFSIALIFAREVIQISGAISIGSIAGDIKIKHQLIGKFTTIMQVLIIYCSLLIKSESLILYFSLFTSFFAIGSAMMYIHNGLIQLPNNPNAPPTKQ